MPATSRSIFANPSKQSVRMEEFEVKISDNTLAITNGAEGQAIALPFDIAQQPDADQWLTNFRRQFRYACANVGWEVSPEQQVEMVKQIVTTEAVKQRIEHGGNAFWRDRPVAERKQWLYVNDFETPPVEQTPPPEPGPTNGPDRTPPVATTPKWLIPAAVFGLVFLLAIGYYFLSGDRQSDVKTPQEQVNEAVGLLDNCVSVKNDPSQTLRSSMTEDDFFMIEYPFRKALKKFAENGGRKDDETIQKEGRKIITNNIEKWEYRCKCELVVDCLSMD